MAAAECFFLADGKDQGTIDRQYRGRCTAGGSEWNNSDGLPTKVVGPRLRAWIEEYDLFAGFGICRELSCPLSQRTGDACECQILGGTGPAG